MAYRSVRTITTLDGWCQLLLTIGRCHNPICPCYRQPYRPEEEGRWALPHGSFGLDVIAFIGTLRYEKHHSVPEIHQALCKRGVVIAERTVTNLLARYEELFVAVLDRPILTLVLVAKSDSSESGRIEGSLSSQKQSRRSAMSMKPQPIPEIPAETVRVVRAAFPKGNLHIHLRDTLGTIYQDEQYADLYPGRGQPAYAPWRLALVTVFQFLENLTDRQAADAVRSRLDWKYCLSLELTDAGFDHTVLSEFRTRLVALTAEERFLETMITLCKEKGWLKARGKQRTDSTHILAKIRALNRAECVIETLRHALNVLAVVAPDWLGSQVQPEWVERYAHRAEEFRLPKGVEKRQELLHQVGQDGWGLLMAIEADSASHWMLSIPAVDTLQCVWKQDYLPHDLGGTWIADEDRLPSAKLYFSPYDLDASAATKHSTYWVGYKAHFTETCDEDRPRLITQVTTTIAPTPDRQALPDIHAVLDQRDLLPEHHLVDAGYTDAESL